MKATETGLQPLLEGTKQYVIPLFQRVYCWIPKNWNELWRDLLDIYETSARQEHFMGAIVTVPVDMMPHGVNKYLLIDGQQRLTTIFVILAVIRDLSEGKNDLAEQINELYLINKFGEEANRLKLMPTAADREAFTAIIMGEEIPPSGLSNVYRFYKSKLQEPDSEDNPIDLSRMKETLMHRLAFVSVVLDNDDSPYRIFHSLNGTGVELTQADLVRNHFFMHIPDPEEQQIAYQDIWLPMQEQLDRELAPFMWRYINKDGAKVRQNGVYDAVRVRTSKIERERVVDLLMDMFVYADYYRRLIDPEQESNTRIRWRLQRINRWEIKTAYPFLLNIYHDFAQGRISIDQVCQILDLIEAFVVRRFFCRIPTNALNTLFVSMYHSIDHDNLVESAGEYLLARNFPTDEEFLEHWARYPIYSSGTKKCRHVLESLEVALNTNNEPVDLTHDRITIEHIMPQQLNEAWIESLGPDAENILAVYQHTVGNLTLTGRNEAMGNIAFEEKRPFFEESNFELSRGLVECDTWNKSTIIERARALGSTALEVWQRPAGDGVFKARDGDPKGRRPIGFTLMSQQYNVRSWREMLVKTCAVLAEHYGEAFVAKVTQSDGDRYHYIYYTNETMTRPSQIPGTELWIETNRSARRILFIISKILQACGHPEEDFAPHWE